ncbi:hypothetical protein [Vogesella sp. LIG4]|uniref:hypothetical protein n=1 Tax=Vogesella sp. LIG4 TaxID=1192162 RepID=UPI00081FF1C6|nr:hypothetical protein [Vogesella sp. LIG4]SCK13936.1 hypothetical protein PSELUDRAFT_1314 [Vogesella sp. LIG4]
MQVALGKTDMRPLWWMLLLALLPVVGSTWLYFGWQPASSRSVGTLVVQPLPTVQAQGWPAGRWALLSLGAGCDAACEQRQFAMRQIRTAQGEDAQRLQLVRQPNRAGLREDGFYLVDPMRNLVLFYPDGTAPTAIIREITRVLKTNNGLG